MAGEARDEMVNVSRTEKIMILRERVNKVASELRTAFSAHLLSPQATTLDNLTQLSQEYLNAVSELESYRASDSTRT